MNILAVIPNRGGSKGIPKKNIVNINGKPLIAYAIEAALESRECFCKVVVSTDSEEIAEVARHYGASVPFIRSKELATDEATSLSVMQHAVQYVEQQYDLKLDWSLLIQATNPLVSGADIKEVVNLAKLNAQATSVVSIKDAMNSHPFKLRIIEDGYLKPFLKDCPEAMRRQDFTPHVYKRNGSLYMTRRDILMEGNDLYGEKIFPYQMPDSRSIDIDTLQDLELAEFLLQKCKVAE